MENQFDLIVVGGGPGGYVAAIRAAQLGFRVALVERDALGGVCLNWGCIPTKALLHGAELLHHLREGESLGIVADSVRVDLPALVAHSRRSAAGLAGGITYLMRKNGITVIEGTAQLSGKCRLLVADADGERGYRADHIVLATGGRPRQLADITIDGDFVWGAREAMQPQRIPQRLLVIGAGAIGVEFASLYRDLGSEVLLVEAEDRILPLEDEEISQHVEAQLRARGIELHTASRVQRVSPGDRALRIVSSGGETQEPQVDAALLAVGITGNIEGLGLESLGVETDGGFVVTDAWSRTNVVGLYAVGDVAGAPCLAHKASREAIVCVEHIAGVAEVEPLHKLRIPACTYSRPQVASVGLTECRAKALGHRLRVGRARLQHNGRAVTRLDHDGLIKTVFDADSGELLGAHLVGAEVTELIHGFALAMQAEASEQTLINTVFPHPTLSESLHEAVLDAMDIPLHQ